jgi:hypothetical protein
VTAEEKRAEIDRRFDETFAVFDARMRKEQETVSQERASRAGSGSGASGSSGNAGDTATGSGQGEEGAGAATGTRQGAEGAGKGGSSDGTGEGGTGEGGSTESGQQGGGGGVGGGAKGGSGPTEAPAGIPDGHDDDIVARQLREAAMKETDPELRERLWEEYRKYKQSTQ